MWAIEKSVLAPLGITCTDAASNSYAYYGDSGTFTFSMNSLPDGPFSLTFGAYESTADIKMNVWVERVGANASAGLRQFLVNPSAVPASASAQASVSLDIPAQKGSLELIKKSKNDTSKTLPGAKFALTGVSVSYPETIKTTDANGKAEWTELEVGTYKLEEREAPPGYNITFQPTNVTITAGNKVSITATNEAYAHVGILKIDPEHGNKPLAGAVFEVKDSSDTVKDRLTTDANGVATSKALPYGTYTITETKSLEWVDIMDPQAVYISHNEQKLYYIIQDPRNERKLKIVKVDSETGKTVPLAGTTFRVWDIATRQYIKQTYY